MSSSEFFVSTMPRCYRAFEIYETAFQAIIDRFLQPGEYCNKSLERGQLRIKDYRTVENLIHIPSVQTSRIRSLFLNNYV